VLYASRGGLQSQKKELLVKIVGTEGMSNEAIRAELDRGGRFVIYQYCISVVFMTFRRPSDIHFVRAGEGAAGKGLKFTLVSVVFGWWGIPWGPIWTIQSIWNNSRGGRDVTQQIVASAGQAQAQAIPQARGA
jgi:hypothetical protein